MLAVSMIVITALIDAPGLGQDVIGALIRNDVGLMFDAGVAIVVLAIILDRLTEGLSARLDPHRRCGAGAAADAAPRPRRHRWPRSGSWPWPAWPSRRLREFPEALTFSFREPINAVVDWLRTNVAWLTSGIKDLDQLRPAQPDRRSCLTTAPAWLVGRHDRGLGWIVSGLRAGVVAGLAWPSCT